MCIVSQVVTTRAGYLQRDKLSPNRKIPFVYGIRSRYVHMSSKSNRSLPPGTGSLWGKLVSIGRDEAEEQTWRPGRTHDRVLSYPPFPLVLRMGSGGGTARIPVEDRKKLRAGERKEGSE